MKYAALAISAVILSACSSDSGRFDGGKGTRRGSGNAPLEGPSAGDVIRDSRHDRARQNYEDRRHRRRYGQYD